MLLQELLKRHGQVVVAKDGLEALDEIRKSYQTARIFDLICLDIMMPKMDGHQALREIRIIEQEMKISYSSRSVIFMTTALRDERTRNDAFGNSCDAYIIKPVRADELEFKLNKVGLIY